MAIPICLHYETSDIVISYPLDMDYFPLQSGPDLMTETTWGVNYRALRDLFHISNARTHVVTYEIGVQMIEIYNEQVRDLLVSDGSSRRYPFT